MGVEEIRLSKEKLGFNPDAEFFIPETSALRFKNTAELGALANHSWEEKRKKSAKTELLEQMLNPDFSSIV